MLGLGAVLTFQLFKPCYVAQEIKSASEGFMNELEQCNWVDADVKLKKLMLFFMGNLSYTVLKINLFGLVQVNLKTFLSVRTIF